MRSRVEYEAACPSCASPATFVTVSNEYSLADPSAGPRQVAEIAVDCGCPLRVNESTDFDR